MKWLLSFLIVISINAFAVEQSSTSELNAEIAQELSISEPKNDSSVTENEPISDEKSADKLTMDNRKESEIPLNLDANKKAANDGSGLFRVLLTLSLLGVLGTGAFLLIRKQSVPKDRKHQTQIKVLQQHYLGPKKSLAIVRVAGESILIGVTDHNISMLKSLSLLDDEVPESIPTNFSKVLSHDLDKRNVNFDEGPDVEDQEDRVQFSSYAKSDASEDGEHIDDFTLGGIKEVVTKRLRGMRSL